MIVRIFLALTALMYIAFGYWSITDPVGLVTRLGVEIGGPSGVFEMRGIFGGVSLGALRARIEFAALCGIAAYMGGYVIGRSASFFYGDSALSSNWYFAGFEAVMFIIAAVLATRKV